MKWRTGCLMLCLMVVLPLGSKALAAEAATDEKVTNLSTQVVLDDVQAAEIGWPRIEAVPHTMATNRTNKFFIND